MLGILDRQRYWSFFKAYVICYVSLVGLYIVIDAFSNLDEFTKRADTSVELFQIMSRYYLVHQSEFFDRLCGVIGMMAAIFTVTWMQRNNEQLAMLAAGISTHRAIIPVLVSSVIVSLFAVGNQELVMPVFGEELARRHDDDGFQRVNLVSTRYDARGIMMHGQVGRPRHAGRSCGSTPRSRGGLGQDPRDRAAAGQLHPARSPHGAAEGGLADPRGHASTRRSTRRSSRTASAILTRVDDLEGFPPPLDVSAKDDNGRMRPTAADVPDEPAPTRRSRPIRRSPTSPRRPPCPSPSTSGLWRAHVLLDRRLDLAPGHLLPQVQP